MTINQLGELSIGALNPGSLASITAATASIGASLPNLQGQMSGLLSAQLAISISIPDLFSQLETALEQVIQILLGISTGVPSVDVQAASVATGIAELGVSIGTLEAQLSIALELQNLLGASVAAWSYDGPCSQLGSELGTYTSGGFTGGSGSSHCNALILATTQPPAWAAVQGLFQT